MLNGVVLWILKYPVKNDPAAFELPSAVTKSAQLKLTTRTAVLRPTDTGSVGEAPGTETKLRTEELPAAATASISILTWVAKFPGLTGGSDGATRRGWGDSVPQTIFTE